MGEKNQVSVCGICCSVCKMNVVDGCFCVAGTDPAAKEKLKLQQEKLGNVCGILECSVKKGIAYCSRDCDEFPCKYYKNGDTCYPYSDRFLKMLDYRCKQCR